MCLGPAFILKSCLIKRIIIFRSSAVHLQVGLKIEFLVIQLLVIARLFRSLRENFNSIRTKLVNERFVNWLQCFT